MFTETLSEQTAKSLALLGDSQVVASAYLAGGTACALQIGHRISVDLDFFTEQEFPMKETIQALQKTGDFQLDQESWGTILGTLDGVRFSLFYYEYPPLFPFQTFQGIQIANLRDIAAMKLDAIVSRGIKRDFIDLYYICQEGHALADILSYYDRKYGALASNLVPIQKSLVYFEDADASPEPKMLKATDWDTVKTYFNQEVKKIAPH